MTTFDYFIIDDIELGGYLSGYAITSRTSRLDSSGSATGSIRRYVSRTPLFFSVESSTCRTQNQLTTRNQSMNMRVDGRDAAAIDFIRTSSSQSPRGSTILGMDDNPIVPTTLEPEPDIAVDVKWDDAWERAVRATIRHDFQTSRTGRCPQGNAKRPTLRRHENGGEDTGILATDGLTFRRLRANHR